MNDWNLYNHFTDGKPDGKGGIQYVRLFSLVAWIILLIACVNFMNLATARSERRAKEVGVRKVMGAERGSLIGQFIVESIGFAFMAVLLGLLLLLWPFLPSICWCKNSCLSEHSGTTAPGLVTGRGADLRTSGGNLPGVLSFFF